ncbi:hypothetical protein [Streptomyces panaciradicis]|uniref:hypothetical protein n=1 Tax=Streptomyces panaciradicis TaxID=1470261 RepID=UPI00201D1BF1|nr:hypothetical protein [Streptomyces panaciradicis]MCL6672279.1 hypothetical protein [Streptomyces panaciradicis]
MAKEFRDDDESDALSQAQDGGGVAEVVQAHAAQTGHVEDGSEGLGELCRVDRSALRVNTASRYLALLGR